MPNTYRWRSIEDDGPTGVGGQVWVAYPNPNHPGGYNLRIQWTPIKSELAVEPMFWRPVDQVEYPAANYHVHDWIRYIPQSSLGDESDYNWYCRGCRAVRR